MKIQQIQQSLQAEEIDVLVATSHDSVFYLTGAYKIPARSIPTRLAAVVIPASGEPTLVACVITRALVEKSSAIRKAVFYREYVDSPTELIGDVIRSMGLQNGRIGIEATALAAGFYDELRAQLPGGTFAAADHIVERVRMVKSPEEIALLARGAMATDRAIRKAFLTARPGEMEKAVQTRISVGILEEGADLVEHVTCGAGETAALAHPEAQMRPLQSGELIRTDAGGIFSGYMSDLARTVVVGEPTREQEEYYEALYRIHSTLIDAARPGITGKELHAMCLDLFQRRGLLFAYTITGHGIGLGQHDAPIIGPDTAFPLEENMVINLEPAHRNLNAIMHIEDTIVITPEGGRILSRSADWSSLRCR